jgi:hypothetical protein
MPSLMLQRWIPHEGPGRGERVILMRQINIWIVLAILLALLAVTRYLRDERDERLERICADNPSASEC